MHLHVCMYRATCVWVSVLALVLLGMADPTSAQPVDIPATWGGDFWSRPRLTGNWGGLRDTLGKHGVALDIDLLHTLQGVATGGRNDVAAYWGTALWSPRPLPQQKEDLMVQQIREDETLCLLCR